MTRIALRTLLLPITMLFGFSGTYAQVGRDPSCVYAQFLGYNTEIRKDMKGNEYSVCIFPDSTECTTWDFFRGLCGQEFSYCALKGCDTKTIIENKTSYSIKYAVCCCTDSSGIRQEIPLLDFMKRHGDVILPLQEEKKE